jgi:hypothetical protein
VGIATDPKGFAKQAAEIAKRIAAVEAREVAVAARAAEVGKGEDDLAAREAKVREDEAAVAEPHRRIEVIDSLSDSDFDQLVHFLTSMPEHEHRAIEKALGL